MSKPLPSVPLLFSSAIMPGLLRTTFPKSITTRLDDGRKLPEVGRVMWAKEAFRCRWGWDGSLIVEYLDGVERKFPFEEQEQTIGDWNQPRASLNDGIVSPLLMPQFMTRYSARLTAVRRERLQDITEEQAMREGLPYRYDDRNFSDEVFWLPPDNTPCWMALDALKAWWDRLHPDQPWESNPMVKRFEWDAKTAEVYRG